MNYDDSLRWLLTLPDFERTGEFADRPDVAPMIALLRALGDPHLGRPTVHIAGSKGKGSTGAMVEAVLRAAGLRAGHYISPHLHRYNERIRIDGEPISQEGFAAAMTAVRDAMPSVEAEFPGRALLAFDALTAASFVAFRAAQIDAQVVEVGLGGLLDSTNVFQELRTENREPSGRAHVCVMTPISLEHTAILGDTVQAIARQKAGIITDGATVVVAPQRESAIDVFAEVARERGATLIEVAKACQAQRVSSSADGQDFRLKSPRGTYAARLPLAGKHQLDNAITAIVACEELVEQGQPTDHRQQNFELSEQAVRTGLAGMKWPGRLEVLKRRPWLIVDGAHNADSAKRMVQALRDDFRITSAVVLFGTLAGKDVAGMVEAVAPIADAVVVTGWPSPRAADVRETAAAFRAHDAPVSLFSSLPDAHETATTLAGERGAVIAFGSLAFVADLREHVLGIESDALRLQLR